jgi:phage shock protein A
MAEKTTKRRARETAAKRRSAAVKAGEPKKSRRAGADEGAACAGDLNLPPLSREDYVRTALEQIEEYEDRLAELESDLESAGWDDVGDFRGQLDDLRLRLKAAREKSAELESVPDAEWNAVYSDMEETLLDLGENVEDLAVLAGRVLPEE